MDLVSASTEKLEPLPGSASQQLSSSKKGEEKWLEDVREKAGRGVSDALFALGQYHFNGGHYHEAVGYFEKAAESANSCAQAKYQLGVMYYDGLGVHEDPAKGFSYMLDVAQSSKKKDSNIVPSAQYNVGRAYFMGFGTHQSDSEAEKWWMLAAERGNDPGSVRAQNTLGLFYAREETLNLDKSFSWHEAAAENGHKESMAALGLFYLQDRGAGGHVNEAGLAWLKRSSGAGCIHGTGLLALQYYTRKLFSKAAETAFKVSELGELSSSGKGDQTIPADRKGAANVSGEMASECIFTPLDCKGVALGCFVLARCLQLGQAVTRSEQKAKEYYDKATKYDKQVVTELHDKLTHGQL